MNSLENIEPEESRPIFQDIISRLQAEGEPVPFSLHLLTSDVIYGLAETPVGLAYGFAGHNQLMLTGFISEEEILEAGSRDTILEEIRNNFKENFSLVNLVRDDQVITSLLIQALEGTYHVKDDIFEAMDATELQQSVWQELVKIPYADTITYEELASRIGKPKAVRAVATAVGNNPVSIGIPCHRVILKSGKMGDYHWGAEIKEKLLAYEQARKQASNPLL